jgi:hypothetical protein
LAVTIKDSAAAEKTFKTTDNAGTHTPHHIVDSSALPSGAATSTLQDDIIALLTTIDGDSETLAGAVSGTEMQVDVLTIAAGDNNIGNVDIASIAAGDNNIGNVDVASSALPTGASTSAKQDTVIGHLDGVETLLGTIDTDTGGIATSAASIDTKTPALGQALAAASVPIVLTAAQITTLTPPAAITGYGTSANQTTIIGHLDGVEGLLTTIDADTGAIMTAVQTLDNAISGNEMQVDVVAALPAGTNNIGDIDVLTIAAGTNAIGNVGLVGRTTGGMTIFRSIDIDESEEEVKATAGQVFSISAFNLTTAPLYLKFYNLTAANTTVGSSTPVLTFVVPGNADSDGAGFVWNNEIGFAFSTAISVAATTGVADADTGAPAANACVINIGYV